MKRILTMMAACLAMAAGAAAQNPIFLNKAYNSDPVAGRACYLMGHVRIDSSNRLAEIRDNDSAAWRDFNFKEGPRKMIISVCPQAGGTMEVISEYMYGGTVA